MFKKLFCRHEYAGYAFTHAKCKKCGNLIYSPEIAAKAIDENCRKMVDAGLWDAREAEMNKIMYGV